MGVAVGVGMVVPVVRGVVVSVGVIVADAPPGDLGPVTSPWAAGMRADASDGGRKMKAEVVRIIAIEAASRGSITPPGLGLNIAPSQRWASRQMASTIPEHTPCLVPFLYPLPVTM